MESTKETDELRFILMRTRENAGLSQKEMGDLIDRTENTICNWENGISTPKFVDVQKWFAALGMPINLEGYINNNPLGDDQTERSIECWLDSPFGKSIPIPNIKIELWGEDEYDYYSGERNYDNFPRNIAEELF